MDANPFPGDLFFVAPEQNPPFQLYLYYNPEDSELDTGFDLTITLDEDSPFKFRVAETFNYDIVLAADNSVVLGQRWDEFGPALSTADQMISGLRAFNSGLAFGMVNANNGQGAFLDLGYSKNLNAFLVARVEVTTPSGGNSNLVVEAGKLGLIHNGQSVEMPEFSTNLGFGIPICLGDPLRGDVNLDGTLNLLDVQPFVERLSNCAYQIEADVNDDGSLNLLDVMPFIDALAN